MIYYLERKLRLLLSLSLYKHMESTHKKTKVNKHFGLLQT